MWRFGRLGVHSPCTLFLKRSLGNLIFTFPGESKGGKLRSWNLGQIPCLLWCITSVTKSRIWYRIFQDGIGMFYNGVWTTVLTQKVFGTVIK